MLLVARPFHTFQKGSLVLLPAAGAMDTDMTTAIDWHKQELHSIKAVAVAVLTFCF